MQEKADPVTDAAFPQPLAEREQMIVVHPDQVVRLDQRLQRLGKARIDALIALREAAFELGDVDPVMEERLAVKCLLRPFTLDETAAYVNFRLQAAGAKGQVFEPAALETLHELTHGLARQINRLCDLALLVAFAEERKSIGSEQLEAVALELVTVAPE